MPFRKSCTENAPEDAPKRSQAGNVKGRREAEESKSPKAAAPPGFLLKFVKGCS